MRATIDKAGRVVLPKVLRDQVGLVPGEVEVVVDSAGLRIEPLSADDVAERAGRLIIPRSATAIDDALISELRHADQR
jgi:AbrB family looped-hinge helix DNA binding protein